MLKAGTLMCVDPVAVVGTMDDGDGLTSTQRARLHHLCDRIRAAHKQHQQADRDGLKHLSEIWRDKLYRESGTFEEFVNSEFDGKTRQWAYNKITQVQVLANLEGMGREEISEKKAQLLKNFSPDVQREIVTKAGGSKSNADWQRIAADYANKRGNKGHRREAKQPCTTPAPTMNVVAVGQLSSAPTDSYQHRATIRYTAADREIATTRLVEALELPWNDFWPEAIAPTPNVAKVIQHSEDGSQDVVEIEFNSQATLLGLLGKWAEFFHVKLGYQDT